MKERSTKSETVLLELDCRIFVKEREREKKKKKEKEKKESDALWK